MRREGWIYALAFFAILAVGVLLILPRLEHAPRSLEDDVLDLDGGHETPAGGDAAARTPPAPAAPEVEGFVADAVWPWSEVTVTGAAGPLRGALRPVQGATVERRSPPGTREPVLRVRPAGARVAFGAVGHQWRRVPAKVLHDGMRVELPVAAAPLVVRVREENGRPAAGIPLLVEPAPPGEPPRTGEDGIAVLDFLAPGLVRVGVEPSARRAPVLRLRAGVDRSAQVVLDPAWEVSGRVLDAAGQPVPAARVSAFGPAGAVGPVVQTGADGRFTWRGPALARVGLHVHAGARADCEVEAQPPAVGPLRTDLGDVALQGAGVTLVGHVRGAPREAGAHVTVEPAVYAVIREVFGEGRVLDRPRVVPLAQDGSFRVAGLPSDLPLRVSVRGAGEPLDALVRGRAGAEVPLDLEANPGGTLAGRLTEPGGGPAAGVRLLLSTEARDGDALRPGDLVATTGPDGSFVRHGLSGRVWFLRAYVPGRRSLLRKIGLPLAAPLELALEPAATGPSRRVTGRVVDGWRAGVKTRKGDPWVGDATDVHYGRPLAGVTVRAAGVVAVTDAEGRFVLDGVESLAPQVHLGYGFEPGRDTREDPRPYLPGDVVEVRPGGPPVHLALWRAAGLRFRALDAVDRTPLSFVYVVLRTDQGLTVFDRGVATRHGVVELKGLPPRGLSLTLLARDRRFARAPIPLEPGQVRDLGDVGLEHGLRVEGRVLGAGDRPLAGARVGVYGRGWAHAGEDPGSEREMLFRTAVTDAQGRFVVEGFDRRRPADLAVWARGYAPTARRVEPPPPGTVHVGGVEVKLGAGAYLALDLTEKGRGIRSGAAVHGALVDLEEAHDGSHWLDLVQGGLLGGALGDSRRWQEASEQLLPEDRGARGYVIGPLRPGPYVLWVERPGYERLRRKLTVIDPHETLAVELNTGTERRFGGRVTRLAFELVRTTH
jgi:hypothetical protein